MVKVLCVCVGNIRRCRSSILVSPTLRRLSLAGLLLTAASCAPTPTRWESSGPRDAARDEAACQARADEKAVLQLPYGNGPPVYGTYSNWSMITWKQAIDDERYYLARALMRACMHDKGYRLVPVSPR